METRISNVGNLLVSDGGDTWRHPTIEDFDALGIPEFRQAAALLDRPRPTRTGGDPDPTAAALLSELRPIYDRIRQYETRDSANVPNRLAALIRWSEYCALTWRDARQTSYYDRLVAADRWCAAYDRQTAILAQDPHGEDDSLDRDYDDCERVLCATDPASFR